MVSDVSFVAGFLLTILGLVWWHPPAAVVAAGFLLIVYALKNHKGARHGKAD